MRSESLFSRYPILWVIVAAALLWLFLAPTGGAGGCPEGFEPRGDRLEYCEPIR